MISLTSPVKTRAHGWPAGAKLAGLCLATWVLFWARDPVVQAVIFAGVLLLYAAPGRVFFAAGLAGVRMIWPFVVLILVWHAVTDDLRNGVVVALRMVNAVALANLVTMTTRLDQMMAVLRWLLTPLRRLGLPVHLLETAVALVIRFTPVLMARAGLLRQAWQARSPRRPGWRLMQPLMLQALDEADQVGQALQARGGPLGPDKE
ncbi:MAG: energy-coupling factor transporter transmembrane component T [Paracoccus sp. (in: a-proteobacteria)]|uniref:energy-coupling factor transporter transmembrane component T family protein n=1 Tax=Paracoccus sp. TaxID=267 RepID=UPI0026E00A80|nr:energy-coupling factor transporter transmembrane component T [Paracoccus sp. (in: a-proteobacteria)]MDO5620626.1 energy-coupling factor transporter transmembrane component T [Paracoccus sp. (in: a-proteobacteria)]